MVQFTVASCLECFCVLLRKADPRLSGMVCGPPPPVVFALSLMFGSIVYLEVALGVERGRLSRLPGRRPSPGAEPLLGQRVGGGGLFLDAAASQPHLIVFLTVA